jgi:histidinol-phosphate aminotransferase
MSARILVLGGTRSGKSAYAEQLVARAPAVVYVATAAVGDDEFAGRVAAHRARRPAHWRTVETTDLREALACAPPDAAVLVDDLGHWVLARLDDDPDAVRADADAFWQAAIAHRGGPVVVVAPEASLGVVPTDAVTRRWLDLHGDVTQRLAATADRTVLVVAGHPTDLPPASHSRFNEAILPGGGRNASTLGAAAGGGAAGGGAASGERRPHGDTMVPPGALDFAVNVHGDGPPPHLRAALDKALDAAACYPDHRTARAAVAARHGRPADDVLLTPGAADAYWLLARTVHARHAVVVHPTFTEPDAALRAAGIATTHVYRRPDEDWRLEPARVPDDADLVIVGNPNNPTGTFDDRETVAGLTRPGRVTVVDEAFVDFVPDADAASLAQRDDLPGLVVLRSVTKLWGLAGIRAGYAIAPPGLTARLEGQRPPWTVSGPALAALEVTAADEAYRRDVAAQVGAARGVLVAALRDLDGVTVYDGVANFLLVRVPDGPGAHAALLARGLAVRPSTFPGLDPDHLRVAVRDAPANARLVRALQEILR